MQVIWTWRVERNKWAMKQQKRNGRRGQYVKCHYLKTGLTTGHFDSKWCRQCWSLCYSVFLWSCVSSRWRPFLYAYMTLAGFSTRGTTQQGWGLNQLPCFATCVSVFCFQGHKIWCLSVTLMALYQGKLLWCQRANSVLLSIIPAAE